MIMCLIYSDDPKNLPDRIPKYMKLANNIFNSDEDVFDLASRIQVSKDLKELDQAYVFEDCCAYLQGCFTVPVDIPTNWSYANNPSVLDIVLRKNGDSLVINDNIICLNMSLFLFGRRSKKKDSCLLFYYKPMEKVQEMQIS